MAIATGKTFPYILEAIQPFPLDGIDPSEFVYGGAFIQLLGSATLSCRLRRSSDNAEQDFGFKDRKVDPVQLLAFGSDLFLVKLYDQVGTGVVWSQPTAGLQLSVVIGGTVVVQGTNIVGANSPAGGAFNDALSNSFNYPKNFAEFSIFSAIGGGDLIGRQGNLSFVTTNGWRNQAESVGVRQLSARPFSSAGASLLVLNLNDVSSPVNGVSSFSYFDDDTGNGLLRNQDTEVSGTWASGSRTSGTTDKSYLSRVISVEGLTTHALIMLNDPTQKVLTETRIKAVMGIV